MNYHILLKKHLKGIFNLTFLSIPSLVMNQTIFKSYKGEHNMYQTRRNQVLNEMSDKSIAIIYSDYPVCPDFFYLTGISRPNMALVLAKNGDVKQSTLFIQKPDPHTEKWNGKLMRDTQAKEISQINDVRYIEGLDGAIMLMLSRQGFRWRGFRYCQQGRRLLARHPIRI